MRLVSIIAHHKTSEERAVRLGKGRRGPLDGRPNTIGRTSHRRSGPNVTRPVQVELSNYMLPRNAMRTFRVQRQTQALQLHPLPSAPLPKALLLHTTSRPDFESFALDLDNDTRARRIRLRVIDDSNPAPEGSKVVRGETRPTVFGSDSSERRQQQPNEQ